MKPDNEMPDRTGRVELLCDHCGTYLMLPRYATKTQVIEIAGLNPDCPKGCPYCGNEMLVRRAEGDA